jgi:hypothetical protein
MIDKLEQQRSPLLRHAPVTLATELFKDIASGILRFPPDPSSKDDLAWRNAANTLLAALPLIEASPDIEKIMYYFAKAISSMVLEKDLQLDWSKLPADEIARRKEAWLKIAPHYEPCVNALVLLHNAAYNHFFSKP